MQVLDPAEVLTVAAHEAQSEPFALTPSDEAPPAPTRGQILRLQQAMAPLAEEMNPAEHLFAPGMYIRKWTGRKGDLVVGKTHRHAHPMFVLKGRALVFSEFGRQEVEAGHVSISQPGAKRVVLCLEETVFATVHVNADDTTDVDVIETRHIEPESPEEIEAAVRGLLR